MQKYVETDMDEKDMSVVRRKRKSRSTTVTLFKVFYPTKQWHTHTHEGLLQSWPHLHFFSFVIMGLYFCFLCYMPSSFTFLSYYFPSLYLDFNINVKIPGDEYSPRGDCIKCRENYVQTTFMYIKIGR